MPAIEQTGEFFSAEAGNFRRGRPVEGPSGCYRLRAMGSQMKLALVRWSAAEPVTDAVILDRYREEGLSPYRWGNGPGDRYGTHTHGYDKVLYCATGSITFVANGEPIELSAGDRLDLPAGTPHSAIVGPRGCSCYEAHC